MLICMVFYLLQTQNAHSDLRLLYHVIYSSIHMQARDLLVSCVIGGNTVVKRFLSLIKKANH